MEINVGSSRMLDTTSNAKIYDDVNELRTHESSY